MTKTRDFRRSAALAMEFIDRAWIDDPAHPHYRGIYWQYDTRPKEWRDIFLELALQTIFDAIYPYADAVGDTTYLPRAEAAVKEWTIPRLQCRDTGSEVYGGILEPLVTAYPYYGSFIMANAVIALLALYQRNGDSSLIDSLDRLEVFLEKARNADYSVKHSYDAARRRWNEYTCVSSAGYLAWGYAFRYHLTGEEKYRKLALAHAGWVVSQQKDNGFISARMGPTDWEKLPYEVTEWILYATEGLYWTGLYCRDDFFTERARLTVDALIAAEKGPAGLHYFIYGPNWEVIPNRTGENEIDMPSAAGQYARLNHYFHALTGEARYRREWQNWIDIMYDLQDRNSDDPDIRGSIPRASNVAARRDIASCYNYVGAVCLEPSLLKGAVCPR